MDRTEPTQAADENGPGAACPRFRYPGPLTQDDLEAMDRLLPARPTEAILCWIAGEGADPWGE